MKPSTRSYTGIRRIILVLMVLMALLALAWAGRPYLETRGIVLPVLGMAPSQTSQPSMTPPATATSTATETPTASPTVVQATSAPAISLANPASLEDNLNREGLMILALRDGLYSHLFAYHPLYLPLTRLTNLPWDDITPAVSPDGTRLAFSSRANGYWDLYLLDLVSGERTRLTDTPDYEAAPSWSPDGQFLAYERFNGANLDIFVLQVSDLSLPPIQLTTDAGIDGSPAWSPQGRQIAFTSSRSGNEDIWLARLDEVDDRFINLSQSANVQDRYPAWSKDGSRLAWAANREGSHRLVVWDPAMGDQPASGAGDGDRPAWSPDGRTLFSVIMAPNQTGLSAFQIDNQHLSLPLIPLPGAVYGMTWMNGPQPAWLAQAVLQGDQNPPGALTNPQLSRFPIAPAGRMSIIELNDVSAPQPRLHDAVDEAYNDLRYQVGQESGWDALSSLENAFVALTTPPNPSIEDEWLYTGRAFALNPLLLSAGWMAIAREDYNGQTYWRIYLKARYQDGSMGKPLLEMTWDLNARYSGSTRAYEHGGQFIAAPSGYWIDMTELAGRYGWERLPSLTNWRTFYPAIHYNQFVIRGGLDWYAAMAQVYPPEALATTTPLPTYTLTPSETPEGTLTPFEPSLTPTITPIPTRRPTWTALP